MLGLFRRLSSFGQVSQRSLRRQRQSVSLQVETLEERCTPTTVTNLGDAAADPNSLRGAIAATPTGGTVDFAPGLTGTIQLTTAAGGQIALTKSVTIMGPGAGVVTVQAAPTARIFFSNTAALNLNISGLTMTGGTGGAPNTTNSGGAIRVNGDNLTLTNCVLTGNTANSTTSPNGNGGALYAQSGTLTVMNCTITNNHALGRRG